MEYDDFIVGKRNIAKDHGHEAKIENDGLFDFQKHIVEWSLKKGRSAIFADTGLGKTRMQLAWAFEV